MRRNPGILLLLALILSACNFALSGPANPTPDLVATQVALQLTQQPTATMKANQATATNPAASATSPSPSATSPAPTATTAATQAATATANPSLTPVPGDPRQQFGKSDWSDTFLNGKSWGLDVPYDDGNTHVEIKDNHMVLTSANAQGWLGWRLSYQKPKAYYLEASLQTNACAANDIYGLVFQATDSQSGYWFGITCDGRYNLRSGDVNAFSSISELKTSDAINTGSNKSNRIGVWVEGSKISLYANGKLLNDFTDTTFPDAGKFGLFIAGQKTVNFTVQCSEIAFWNTP